MLCPGSTGQARRVREWGVVLSLSSSLGKPWAHQAWREDVRSERVGPGHLVHHRSED